jgi:hypothetical protein
MCSQGPGPTCCLLFALLWNGSKVLNLIVIIVGGQAAHFIPGHGMP